MRKSVLEDFVYMSEAHVHVDEVNRQIKRDCQSRTLLAGENSFSLCPTYQELDRDERRTPIDILQTRCYCDRCAMRRRRRYQYKCTPVFRYIPVLMKVGCTNSIYDYMVAEQKVSVACVCSEKLKSKFNRRTEISTKQRIEHDVTRNSNTENKATHYKRIRQPRPVQIDSDVEATPHAFESTDTIDFAQNGTNDGEVQRHHTEGSLLETEKMARTFVSTDDNIDSSEEIQTEIHVPETEKMPVDFESMEGIAESVETVSTRTNHHGLTSHPTERKSQDFKSTNAEPQNVFPPVDPEMSSVYDDIQGYDTSIERMPK
ncbi:uncharacterized protein LOC132552395 [Ylistrum balloti]|uniref:uncharacterized protein LOC132552395 n=1 Tax=Ylistrum balloti TaxID=509963 RepID=UPI00290589F3|nr:uncharacterized protein LOC132552395 [Ylistrum balloti]